MHQNAVARKNESINERNQSSYKGSNEGEHPGNVWEKHKDSKANTTTSMDGVEREVMNIYLKTVIADLIIQIHG